MNGGTFSQTHRQQGQSRHLHIAITALIWTILRESMTDRLKHCTVNQVDSLRPMDAARWGTFLVLPKFYLWWSTKAYIFFVECIYLFVECIYLVMTRTPGGSTIGGSGLCVVVSLVCRSLLFPFVCWPFRPIHIHFVFSLQNLSHAFPVLAAADTGSCVGPQNKIGHLAGCGFPCWVPAEYDLLCNDLWNE